MLGDLARCVLDIGLGNSTEEVHVSLSSVITALALSFANDVLAAVRGASLEDIIETGSLETARTTPRAPRSSESTPKKPRKAGRLARRSDDDIEKMAKHIVELVGSKGMRAEEIRSKLGLLPKEMPRVLKDGLAAKKLTSKGQKRATTYFAA